MSLDISLVCLCCNTHVFDANITHNLIPMAREAGVYEACWHPKALTDPEAYKVAQDAIAPEQTIKRWDRYHLIMDVVEWPTAALLIEPLRRGVEFMRGNEALCKTFDHESRWGTYGDFLPWLERYLAKCTQFPAASVGARL